jgi:PAS domain S-box-containing protein
MAVVAGSEPEELWSKPEMKERVREFDWASTPLGPPADWPPSLKTSADICLNSRFPMVIWWGRDLIIIHNDAWRPIIGVRSSYALGKPGQTVLPEAWDLLGPMLHSVLDTGEPTWSDDQLVLMRRSRYVDLEEAYFTWSYSAILDESGKVGGVFTAVTETTDQVTSERRLETLRKLSARASEARTVVDACRRGAEALAENPGDIPFALLYLIEPGSRNACLVERVRVDPGTPAAPERVNVEAVESSLWPIADTIRTGSAVHVTDVIARFGALSGGRWPAAPTDALVVPLTIAGQTPIGGVAIIGISPYRRFDSPYRSFLDLAAGHLATGISNANAYEQERKRAEALAELDRAKTTFFSNVSHEFRTPLTLMLGPLEDLLGSGEATIAAFRERLDVIHRNGLRLLKLVNNLLDFSRIEAGRSQAVYEPIDLAALTAELASIFRSAIEKAGLELIVDCDPFPEPVFIDREMWEKIVLNLLSNAFKFTLEGSIRVRLRMAGTNAEFSIEDTGTGIPEDQLPQIFERFHRVIGARARSHEGTGIGLALVQELVKLHGGSVRVVSTAGRGTTFTVAIPLGKAHLPSGQIGATRSLSSTALRADVYVEEALRWLPEAARYAPAQPPNGTKEIQPAAGKVVLADDNADMRDYLRRLLMERYEVVAVANGAEVLDALRNNPLPDLVLTDVMMPIMDGFELIQRLRDDDRTRTLPVIMLSARAGNEARVEGLQAGADDYLVKPFTARELLARVHSQIALSKARRMAELTVRAAEEHLRLAVDAAELGTWEMNPDTGELKLGDRCRAMFAVPQDEEVDADVFLSRVHPDDRERMRLAWEQARRPDTDLGYEWQYRIQWPDGATRWIVAHGRTLFQPGPDGDKPIVRMVGTVRDITELKRAEESLRETQKLESLGLLAGGIAHDFNNLLTGVLGNASLLADDLPADSPPPSAYPG